MLEQQIEDNDCPNCGKPIPDHQDVKIDGDYIGYPFTCSCGFIGVEWYKR